MINYIWLSMMVLGILAAIWNGNVAEVTKAAMEGAEQAVKISLGLIAIISFWLGIMRLAEKSGLIGLLAKIVAPVTKRLFPEIPKDHPAMGAIIMNISANMLGLGNAATPMGLIAMQEMQKLNQGDKEVATSSMCTFLALNTACITLIPSTIIGIRILYDSKDPTCIVGATILATAFGMLIAIVVDRLMRMFYAKKNRN